MKRLALAILAATCLISAVAETETTNMTVTGTVVKDYCQFTAVPTVALGTIDASSPGSTTTYKSNTYYGTAAPTGWLYIDCADGTDYSLHGDYDADGHVFGDARIILSITSVNATVNYTPTDGFTDNTAVGTTSSLELTTTPGAQEDGFAVVGRVRSASGDLNNLPEDLATTIPLVFTTN